MLTFAYPVEGEFKTVLNCGEVEEELWISAREALARLDLPYQIKAAVYSIARFATVAELLEALAGGSMDEDFRF
jgi:hypothetical protein